MQAESSGDELPAYFEAPTSVLICKHPQHENQMQVFDLSSSTLLYTVNMPTKYSDWKLELFWGDGLSIQPEIIVYREKTYFLPDHTLISYSDSYSTKIINKFSSKYSFQSADGTSYAWKGNLIENRVRKLVVYPSKQVLASYNIFSGFMILKLHPSVNNIINLVIATFLTTNEWERVERWQYRIPTNRQLQFLNRGRSRSNLQRDSQTSLGIIRPESGVSLSGHRRTLGS
ncbi:hypothetical protein HDV06_004394 [Boothiomyces sp. JEL0866]|nr:hypothetical protein HDV06_004394 [Boothiomyces sp. JEL0866]